MIHVLVADRVPLFRCGIRAALESTLECKVVGEATERAGIIQLLQEQHPDVLVLDAGLLAPDDLFRGHRCVATISMWVGRFDGIC